MPINKYEYIFTTLKNHPLEVFDIIASALTTFKYRYLKRCIEKGVIVRKHTQVINYGNVQIGEHSILQDNIYIRAGVNGRVILGKGCMVNSFCRFFGHGGIEIGEHTQIGPGVTLTTTGHNYLENDMSEEFAKITLGKRVWLGANVTILPGVTIGDNTVIGAGSVVTKNLPSDCVAVGVPARVVKTIKPAGNGRNKVNGDHFGDTSERIC